MKKEYLYKINVVMYVVLREEYYAEREYGNVSFPPK